MVITKRANVDSIQKNHYESFPAMFPFKLHLNCFCISNKESSYEHRFHKKMLVHRRKYTFRISKLAACHMQMKLAMYEDACEVKNPID